MVLFMGILKIMEHFRYEIEPGENPGKGSRCNIKTSSEVPLRTDEKSGKVERKFPDFHFYRITD